MCGISGILNLRSEAPPVDADSVLRMLAILMHRGPDQSGVYLDDRIGLGHNRLSIIDLSAGIQPISNEDDTLWIIYNGEVFNYLELRDELIKRGHRFKTSTDTEVILHLYEESGADSLGRLNGQFAFAIWDSRKSELFLARDRVGIRPLFYTVHDNRLLFASEIKSLFVVDGVPREIDPIALDQVFTFWTTLGGRTAFKGIHELPPGHFLRVSKGETCVRKYWDIPFCAKEEQYDLSENDVRDRMAELILDSVRIRLRADVPVGAYVSGGLDSSGITALVKNNFNNRLRTFGIEFEDDAFDESEYQQCIVSFLKTEHTAIRATNDQIGASFPDVVWHCEKPLLRTAPVPLFLLSREVRNNGFKVVLTGEGADEVFGGYNIFRESKIRRFWARQPDSRWRPLLIEKLYPYIFKDKKLKSMLQSFFAAGLENVGEPLYSHLLRWQNTSKTKGFFSEDVRSSVGDYSGYDEVRNSLPETFSSWDDLAKAQYLEMTIFMSNYLLSSQGDRVAMANSLEIRLPFLDFRIIEFMARVPSIMKIRVLQEKHILKKVFKDILPERIITRPKHPYRAPIVKSLFNERNGKTLEMLSEKRIRETGLFDPARVGRLVSKMQSVRNAGEVDNMAVAGIVSCQLIHEQFIENFSLRTPKPLTPALIIDRREKALNAPPRGK
jgi:asparagine synthase (glutamine-hydrolysing)